MNRIGTGTLVIVWVVAAFACREDLSVGGSETSCADGEDNDGDCLVDSDDPDCAG